MSSTIVTEPGAGAGWSAHCVKFVSGGVDSMAVFGLDGRRWGGASLSGFVPLYGVRTIPKFATLLADLQAGRMSTALTLEGITYMATQCVAKATMYGKRGSAICGIGLSHATMIVITADTTRTASSTVGVRLESARGYFKQMSF